FIESVRLNGSPVRCSYFHDCKAVRSVQEVATKCKYRLILSVVDDEESYWLNRISLVSWIYVFDSRFESNQLLLSFLGRKKQRAAQNKCGLAQLPDLKDAAAVQKFFLDEIQLGEELLAQGDYEKGVDHLTNAIAVCGQPPQLLQVLPQTLPPPVFQMLLTKLPTISQRIVSAQSLEEDDVE
uniref:Mitochondrial import receptor subunit TOM20 homolog n=1 Tax=Cyprinus carpio TaxID=7962 RepID=A0A8C1PIF1_CYPCA